MHVHAKPSVALTRSSTRGMKLRNATTTPAISRNGHLHPVVADIIALAPANNLYILTTTRRAIRYAIDRPSASTIHASNSYSRGFVLKKGIYLRWCL